MFNFNFFSKRGSFMSGIEGKVVAITGASSGIGEATALVLADDKHRPRVGLNIGLVAVQICITQASL